MKTFFVAAALFAAIAGVVVGLVPVQAPILGADFSCGAPFYPTEADDSFFGQALDQSIGPFCDRAIANRWGLVGTLWVGAVLLVLLALAGQLVHSFQPGRSSPVRQTNIQTAGPMVARRDLYPARWWALGAVAVAVLLWLVGVAPVGAILVGAVIAYVGYLGYSYQQGFTQLSDEYTDDEGLDEFSYEGTANEGFDNESDQQDDAEVGTLASSRRFEPWWLLAPIGLFAAIVLVPMVTSTSSGSSASIQFGGSEVVEQPTPDPLVRRHELCVTGLIERTRGIVTTSDDAREISDGLGVISVPSCPDDVIVALNDLREVAILRAEFVAENSGLLDRLEGLFNDNTDDELGQINERFATRLCRLAEIGNTYLIDNIYRCS